MTEETSYVILNNGNKMPMRGFGTLLIKDPALCEKCIYDAIYSGLRMIDTAPSYFNEEYVGRGIRRAIQEGIVKREELFVITKLWIQDTPKGRVRWALDRSLKNLGLDYIDMYLIHQPFGKYMEAWPIMEELVQEGKIKNIGVSNFSEEKLKELSEIAKIQPVVNQIEIHPYFTHNNLITYMKKHEIMPMAWGPLCEGQRDIFHDETLVEIGEKYHKSAAQVILRWHLDNEIPVVFKTTRSDHLKEDLDIDDFSLDEEDRKKIALLDIGHSEIIDYKNPKTEKWLTGWNIYE